jgi:pimeloyl-ACP methyl ester carboxylesterase
MQGDIDGYTEQIAQRVTWLRGRTHAKRVVLVGHGMGGLACLAYLRRYGEENVERLVILGAPLAGVSWLPAGWGRNLDQLRANSRWLSELAVFFGEWPLLTPRVNYQGRCDYWFPSPEAAPIQGLEARWLENVGHIGLLVSARVLDELLTSSE